MRIDATHANDLRESKRGRRGWDGLVRGNRILILK